MERYCVLDERIIKNIDKFKWKGNEDFKGLSLIEIYKQMLETYYSPISVSEIYDHLMDKAKEELFWERRKYNENKDIPLKENILIYKDEYEDDFLYNMHNEESDKGDFLTKYIIRGQIIPFFEIDKKAQIVQIDNPNKHFYLDILQALLYSLRYYRKKDTMVYLNPFQERKKEDIKRDDFVESLKRFKRKGADRVRNEKNKTQKEIESIKMLRDYSVEIPLDTRVEITEKGIIKIPDFAPDVIRFFIKREQKEGKSSYCVLDFFSKKRRDRFTPEKYEKYNIKKMLDKFERYSNDSDDIIEQFLLEQCFGLDTSECVYNFIENVIFTNKIVKNEVKNNLANIITTLVRMLRFCEPMFSKKLILDETAALLKHRLLLNSASQESLIKNACLRLHQAVRVEQELILEMNFVYRGFSKCFFYALYDSLDGDLLKVDERICEEIKRVKEIEEKPGGESNSEDIVKKSHDDLFPYIQKAMMVER